MTQSAASGWSESSTDSRKAVGIEHAGLDGTNVTIALPPSLISAPLFVALQVGISIFLVAVRVAVGSSFHCQGTIGIRLIQRVPRNRADVRFLMTRV